MSIAHGFVDGGYVMHRAREGGRDMPDPVFLVIHATSCAAPTPVVRRVTYYDALRGEEQTGAEVMQAYWNAVELQPLADLGFGSLKRIGTRRRAPRQKGVDTLIATHMLVGAFDRLFSHAVLVAADADYVPVVDEVRRRGVEVILAASEQHAECDLRRACDRFIPIDPAAPGQGEHFVKSKPLTGANGETFSPGAWGDSPEALSLAL